MNRSFCVTYDKLAGTTVDANLYINVDVAKRSFLKFGSLHPECCTDLVLRHVADYDAELCTITPQKEIVDICTFDQLVEEMNKNGK